MTLLDTLNEFRTTHRTVAARLSPGHVTPTAEEVLQALDSVRLDQKLKPMFIAAAVSPELHAAVRKLLAHPELNAAQAIRLLYLCGFLHYGMPPDALEAMEFWWDAHGRGGHLGDLANTLQALGRSVDDVSNAFLLGFIWPYVPIWPDLSPDFMVPFFLQRPERLLASLAEGGHPRSRALRIMESLPSLVPGATDTLLELALADASTWRSAAQAVLTKDPHYRQRLLQSLESRTASVRQHAAEWAGRIGLADAVPILTRLVAKEKTEKTRLAQMGALERLGAPLDSYLDRDTLLADARKALAKGGEFAWEILPQLHWQTDGAPVHVDLVRGTVAQSLRLKSPEPNPILKRVCSYWTERETLGIRLLDWWIAKDTVPRYTAEEVEARLPAAITQVRNMYQGLITIGVPGATMKSDAALEAEARRTLELDLVGSAIGEKGILALVAACGGKAVVDTAERYIKRWYGMRAPQCKALVAMLAHVDHPAAIQLLLSLARRFRTRGIQDEARARVQSLAERMGWSVDDLADRTLPTAGFEDEPVLLLDYGSRTFTATLDSGFQWRLEGEDGKPYKSLPDAASGDDADKVKAAQKQFKTAQKEVKDLQKALKDRLYEAMCLGRAWPFDTWDGCFRRHPVARFFCQSLVWMCGDTTFRPTEDGTLTSARHESLDLASDVRLAHRVDVDDAMAAAWTEHLSDYRIIPPLNQFGRNSVQPPAAGTTQVDDYIGYLLQSFTLRSKANTLGYDRGPTEDGGAFTQYRKSIGTSGWAVIVSFSGSRLPETLHVVALESLWFEFEQRRMPLDKVPPILYCEAVNDLQEMAAQATFDAAWSSQVTWE